MSQLEVVPPQTFIDPERDIVSWVDRYAARGWLMVVLHGVNPDGSCTCSKGPDCRSAGKHPRANAWQDKATSNADEIKRQILGRESNLGIATGHGIVVLDVDGELGQESLSQLLDEHPNTQIGPVCRTGSGGLHLYFKTSEDFTNKVKMLPGLDVRSFGGQVVACPSKHKSGSSYVWENASFPIELPELPDWLADLLRGTSDTTFNASAWLAKQPPAITGEGGSRVLMTMMAKVLHNSEVRTVEEMLEVFAPWNETCQPPWSDRELEHAFQNAYKRFAAGSPVKLPIDDKGRVICTRTGLHEILTKDPKYEFALSRNTRTGDILYNNTRMIDSDMTQVELDICARYCLREIKKSWIIDSLALRADENGFDPVVSYLKRLDWDGQERLAHVPTKILRCDESALSSAIFTKWAIGAVRRALMPGCKMDNVLILHGLTGCGKSSFFRAMAGDENFADTSVDLNSKDAYQALGCWILEWGELVSLRRSESQKVKAFITSQTDKYRRPFDRLPIEQKRSGVIVGSTNDDTFLNDPTGSRRFWVLEVKDTIRLDFAIRDRDQLWAEAVARAKKGEPHWLTADQENARELVNARFQQEDVLFHQVREYAEASAGRVSIPTMCTALDLPNGEHGRIRDEIVRALKSLGFSPGYTAMDGHRKRMWIQRANFKMPAPKEPA